MPLWLAHENTTYQMVLELVLAVILTTRGRNLGTAVALHTKKEDALENTICKIYHYIQPRVHAHSMTIQSPSSLRTHSLASSFQSFNLLISISTLSPRVLINGRNTAQIELNYTSIYKNLKSMQFVPHLKIRFVYDQFLDYHDECSVKN